MPTSCPPTLVPCRPGGTDIGYFAGGGYYFIDPVPVKNYSGTVHEAEVVKYHDIMHGQGGRKTFLRGSFMGFYKKVLIALISSLTLYKRNV